MIFLGAKTRCARALFTLIGPHAHTSQIAKTYRKGVQESHKDNKWRPSHTHLRRLLRRLLQASVMHNPCSVDCSVCHKASQSLVLQNRCWTGISLPCHATSFDRNMLSATYSKTFSKCVHTAASSTERDTDELWTGPLDHCPHHPELVPVTQPVRAHAWCCAASFIPQSVRAPSPRKGACMHACTLGAHTCACLCSIIRPV